MILDKNELVALRSVLDKAAIVATALAISLNAAEELLDAVEKFFTDAATSLRGSRFVLAFRLEDTGDVELSHLAVLKAIESKTPILHVNASLKLLQAYAGETSLSESLSRTTASKGLELVWQEGTLHYVAAGRHVHDYCLTSASDRPIPSQRWYRPFSQLDAIIKDHMDGAVQYEKHVRYWKDKKKRILSVGLDGTEKIFHAELFWWLDNFLTDKAIVYAQPSGFGQDSTDIIVMTVSGGRHVIEIKWLGENENKTTYKRPQINAGLIQVKTYLQKDATLLSGYLVVYDGREEQLHKTESGYNENHLHPKCGRPFILFLESETPSQIAAREARAQ